MYAIYIYIYIYYLFTNFLYIYLSISKHFEIKLILNRYILGIRQQSSKLRYSKTLTVQKDILEDFEDYDTFSSKEMNSSNLEDLYEQEMLITGKNGILPYEPTTLDIEMYKEEIRESVNYMKAASFIQFMQPLQYFIFQTKLEYLINS